MFERETGQTFYLRHSEQTNRIPSLPVDGNSVRLPIGVRADT